MCERTTGSNIFHKSSEKALIAAVLSPPGMKLKHSGLQAAVTQTDQLRLQVKEPHLV
jgi:hypothetical protein